MSARWTEEQLAAHYARMTQKKREPRVKGYTPTVVDGMRFQSQTEARYYIHLRDELIPAGSVEYFLRQVPLHLPGGVILRIDFVPMSWHPHDETEIDGCYEPRYIDVKGYVTREFKTKKRIAEAMYPIKIEIARWKGGQWVYF